MGILPLEARPAAAQAGQPPEIAKVFASFSKKKRLIALFTA
jgi:hypothetical protein